MTNNARDSVIDAIWFPSRRLAKYMALDASNWQMTRSGCTSFQPVPSSVGSRDGMRVTDHLFSDQPAGIDLQISVEQRTRLWKSGEAELQLEQTVLWKVCREGHTTS